jgi:hypothetical protein
LHELTGGSLTVWSYDHEQPATTLASLFLFRKYFIDRTAVFYDLGPVQDAYLKNMLSNKQLSTASKIDRFLSDSASSDQLIHRYLNDKRFDLNNEWRYLSLSKTNKAGSLHSILLNSGATFESKRPRMATKNFVIRGKFEIFALDETVDLETTNASACFTLQEPGNPDTWLELNVHTNGLCEVKAADGQQRVEAQLGRASTSFFEFEIKRAPVALNVDGNDLSVQVIGFEYAKRVEMAEMIVKSQRTLLDGEVVMRFKSLSDGFGIGVDYLNWHVQ